MLHNKRGQSSERPTHCDEEWSPLATTRESPRTETKTQQEIGSLPEKPFRIIIVNMIQNRGNRIDKIQEKFNKDLEELKSKQTMMNNTINKLKIL